MSSLFQILGIIVLFQLFFISFFLITNKKGRRLSNYLLAFFFIALGAGLLDYILLVSGIYQGESQYAFILNGLVLFHPPLLLLYTQSLTSRNFKLKWVHLLHGTFYLISMVLLVFFYYNKPPQIQEFVLKEVEKGADISMIAISVIGLVYELGYLTAIKRRIRSYRQQIKEQFSNLDKINLDWLNFFVNIFILSFLASVVANVVRHSQLLRWKEAAMIVGLIGLFIFITSVLLKGLHHNDIFLGGDSKLNNDPVKPQANKALLQKLKDHLEKVKSYLNPELTINQLADQLEVPARQLSTLINSELGQTFFDLINRYRIEEAKRQLRETGDQKLTILEVMYKVGFNSKSSFNTAFKKYTGTTPSAFKSQLS
ncbi:MAG: helix-turn-helix domain-containing protein [Cyclobacteriaceae bacterium]